MPEILINNVLKTNPWLETKENTMDYIFEILQDKQMVKMICSYSSQSRK